MKKPHVKRIVLLIAAVFVFLAAVIIGKRLITPITYSCHMKIYFYMLFLIIEDRQVKNLYFIYA